ncbi:CUE domain-containing protein 1 [Parasteatoda tepidariorum]|uniref:CUE domain-containing protein 1 n=1 Tax=Parasteatoda tepidariorum TaxID=114398 RepID=UPI000A2C066E|nr:CUE domain-containing protein 1 [Parasteatoda tepidariorum]
MAAVDQEQQQQQQCQERPPVTQLEFRQAMRDFKTMFPEMDEDVIEVVLRSNNGAVDSTIDQLLTMSTDNENEKLRTELDATENDELPPCYSPSTPPPSYNQAVPYAQSPAHALAAGDTDASNVTPREACAKQPTVQPQLPTENGRLSDVSECSEISIEASRSDVAMKVLKNWNPPLLGELPPQFLKISGLSVVQPSVKKVTVLSSTVLQQRMEENERKRNDSTSANDPELTQYLEDERIALFLQNEEFFQELKDNKEFLSTLEREVSSPEEEEADGEEVTEELDSGYPYCESAQPEETDAAFREKLKNMGKVSRKKFTQLAKLFSRRKRRSFKPILGDGSNPSRDNLLLHEDEYSEVSEDDSETEVSKKDTWNSHVGGPGGRSQTIERSKMDSS